MPDPNVVVRGTNDKPVASEALAAFFESSASPRGGQLFIGYPITTAADGRSPLDAVYVSPTIGVVVFDLVEGVDLGDYEDRQDDAATRLEIRLKQHKPLVHRRDLVIPITSTTFAPAVRSAAIPPDEGYDVANEETLGSTLQAITWPESNDDAFRRTLSALQSISGIRRSAAVRPVETPHSRGAKLKRLENSIATLDAQQSQAVIETARGVQRIRGLAGSGKTVVLALKAAYLHAQHPEWHIAVTFNTRSLRDQFRRLINNFTIEQTGDEPDWSKIEVLQAWGAAGGGNREGVYHQFCAGNDVPYRDFNYAKSMYGSQFALAGVCAAALEQAKTPKPLYDAMLIDEAQDLPPAFLRMCYTMLGDDKRLIYAYDELQTLNGSGLPPAETIFGTDTRGEPLVTFDSSAINGAQRDIILKKCYRNSRPALVAAHALGFGIYRDPPKKAPTGLVQIFEQKELWTDIGYRVLDGQLTDGSKVTLGRDDQTSPRFLEDHSPIDDLISFHVFGSHEEQAEWIAENISLNLKNDELVTNDIMVINPDPFTTRKNLGPVRKRLLDKGVDSHLAGVDVGADIFFRGDMHSVTFTGIYRAKGNEAGMVYVANAHESFSSTANLARVRNRLFTAITRSKAWVRVTGVGPEMQELIDEYQKIRAATFKLEFRYPTETERATMQILHRDMSRADERRVEDRRRYLHDLVQELETGELYAEDLDVNTLERLKRLLDNGDG